MQKAGKHQHRLKIVEKLGNRNKKQRRAKSANRSENLRQQGDKKEDEDFQRVRISVYFCRVERLLI